MYGVYTGIIAGGGLMATAGAATGAMCSALGAAILDKQGYEGFSQTEEMIKATAGGTALTLGATGAVIGGCLGGLLANGLFTPKVNGYAITLGAFLGYPSAQIIGSAIGAELFIAAGASTLNVGNVVAAAATGAGVTVVPLVTCTVGLLVCLGACLMCSFAARLETPETDFPEKAALPAV